MDDNNVITHKGHTYWITIQPTLVGREKLYVAYVSKDIEATKEFFGDPARDHNGDVIAFKDGLTALTNAVAIIQSY